MRGRHRSIEDNETVVVSFRIGKRDLERVEKLSRVLNRSLSSVLRTATEMYVRMHGDVLGKEVPQ